MKSEFVDLTKLNLLVAQLMSRGDERMPLELLLSKVQASAMEDPRLANLGPFVVLAERLNEETGMYRDVVLYSGSLRYCETKLSREYGLGSEEELFIGDSRHISHEDLSDTYEREDL